MRKFRILALMLVLIMVLAGCGTGNSTPAAKDIVILYTNDAHCGIEDGMGYQGLSAAKRALLAAGNKVLLVDNGDAVQGDTIGTLSKGEYIIDIMNKLGYDVATPGNHEFDYGMDQFNKLVEKADFDYISCNFVDKDGNPVLKPYVIKEADGVKIAFVGISTPKTITTSTPTYFQDGNGNYIYGFMQDDTGEKLYTAVQSAVDAARKEGAKYVIAMAHLGIEADCQPWTSSDVIVNTSGIDVVLDGHSHSTIAGDIVKNKEGKDVILTSTGTKLANIGCLTITADGKLSTALINDDGMGDTIAEIKSGYEEIVNTVVASTKVELTVNDPVSGERMVRRQETNLGDLCADAYRAMSGADIAVVNGGGIRVSIPAGDITYGQIIKVHPYGNALCVVEATGQEIIDALEWTARNTMSTYSDGENSVGEMGGFLQVSGLKYTIDTTVKSSAKGDDKSMFVSVDGAYRVKNVKVLKNGKYVDIDPKATYTVASHNYMLKDSGDGINMFADNKLLQDSVMLDNQVLINYIKDDLGGTVPASYAAPQGRISIIATPYTDVVDGNWAVEAVNYVTEKNYMKGLNETTFGPNGALTRGMLVTVLYRMAGSPKVEGKVSEKFSDCTDGSWYADAVLWASANKVVDGYEDGTFKPTKSITRQEMAKVLYGYDKIGGKTAEGITEKLTYTDLDAIADWALEAVTYCTAEKYLAGSNGAFSPKGTATRAMGAKVLMNMTKEAA